jgi:Holliday junction resolvase-like predicted endonuclease
MSVFNNHRRAVTAAKVYLEMRSFEIIELNWHRSRSKIDVIAKHNAIVYLIWVKFTSNVDSGGSDPDIPITTLQRQMNEARELWTDENKWTSQCDLSLLEISGAEFTIMAFINGLG